MTISNRLNFFTGSFINSQIQIEAFLTNYTLSEILDYSTGSMDDLEIGTYNIENGVPAPWTAFRLGATTLPVTSIEVDDILAGVGILPSTIVSKGGSGFTDVVVVDLDLSGLTQILPTTGSIFSLLRPLVKPALTIETPNGTDIFLNSQGLGDTIANTNIVPLVTAQNKLGLPTRRWKEIWVASGSIYMQDETLGIDLRMTARDGNFVVDGAAGLEVGEFILNDNQIKIKDPNREIIIGQTIASGSVIFNRPIKVNASSGQPTFNVGRDGRVQIISPQIPAGDIGAFSIIGNSSGLYQPVTSDGSMVHITGNDGKLNRFNMDSFGTGSFNSMVFRTARGTAASPLQLKANDTILRLAGAGWKSDTGFAGPSAGFSAVSIDFVSLNDQTSTTAGTQHQFYNSPLNQNVRTLSATLDASGLFISGAFTSSLSEGYIWVGGVGNRTNLISTASFEKTGRGIISGSSQLTSSLDLRYAITGSNTFSGSQGISGSLYVSESLYVTNEIYLNGNKLFNYAQFSDTTTQSGSANTAYSMKFNTTDISHNISMVSGSRITVQNTGIYNLQFSAQLDNDSNTNEVVDIWLAVTGSNIPNSTTTVAINKAQAGNFGKLVAAWNYMIPLSASQYVELKWNTHGGNIILLATGSASNPTRPATPSVIATITQIA